MIIDDTGSPATVGSRPWQAVVTVLGEAFEAAAVLPGQDAIMLQRTTAAGAAAVTAALVLGQSVAQSLQTVPDGTVAVARPGAAVRLAQLAPGPAERTALAGSLQRG
ncbi:MAG TPA: hypothetical protein VMV07_10465 [Streptosporangiaceae bacterium]|nr:hypothetical protein [Streptosporangiaceae bacterium]